MTALWGDSCCCSLSSFRRNTVPLSCSVINSANICIVRYLYAPAHYSDLIKKHPETNLKNDLNYHHSSTFTYRDEGMSENAANISGSLPTWVNVLFVSIQWGKPETALYMSSLAKQSCFFLLAVLLETWSLPLRRMHVFNKYFHLNV